MLQMITKRKDRMIESAEKKFAKPEEKKNDQLQVARKHLEMVSQELKALSPPPKLPPAPKIAANSPKIPAKNDPRRKNSSPGVSSASKFLQKLKERVGYFLTRVRGRISDEHKRQFFLGRYSTPSSWWAPKELCGQAFHVSRLLYISHFRKATESFSKTILTHRKIRGPVGATSFFNNKLFIWRTACWA